MHPDLQACARTNRVAARRIFHSLICACHTATHANHIARVPTRCAQRFARARYGSVRLKARPIPDIRRPSPRARSGVTPDSPCEIRRRSLFGPVSLSHAPEAGLDARDTGLVAVSGIAPAAIVLSASSGSTLFLAPGNGLVDASDSGLVVVSDSGLIVASASRLGTSCISLAVPPDRGLSSAIDAQLVEGLLVTCDVAPCR